MVEVVTAPTPAQLLDGSPVQSCGEAAIILRLLRRNGEPNRRQVHALIRSGALELVDPMQPIHRWTVSSVELRRYIAEGPRRADNIDPISFAVNGGPIREAS